MVVNHHSGSMIVLFSGGGGGGQNFELHVTSKINSRNYLPGAHVPPTPPNPGHPSINQMVKSVHMVMHDWNKILMNVKTSKLPQFGTFSPSVF